MNTVTCYTCGITARFDSFTDRWVHVSYYQPNHKVTGPPPTRSADRLADGMAADDWADRERGSR